ncbi:lipid A biosynthesis acyltransferase [Maribacter algicola]|uniref:Lipid A biosynthesis acyltransferase n=1 Tax=Meishania litoralis TaxID=3434685 RepID=A0ACC7LHQ4_9FLAO
MPEQQLIETEWKGRSKGTLLGYKIYIFVLKNFGLNVAYLLLRTIVFYYFLFSYRSSKAIYPYFRKRLGYSRFRSIISIYKNYFLLGQTLSDRVTVSTGYRDVFDYTHDGIEKIDSLLKKRQGGILISGHLGNFEISHYFLENRYSISKISMVTTQTEQENIQEYLSQMSTATSLELILVKEDMSHIFEIHAALDKGGLVVITGDRFMAGSKYLTENLLGAPARFPLGPFRLASRLKVPVLFVYVMKGKKRNYRLYARTADTHANTPQLLLKEYTKSMEWMLTKYPLQWFNYFDFWGDNVKK